LARRNLDWPEKLWLYVFLRAMGCAVARGKFLYGAGQATLVCRAVKRGGIPKAVAVDMECARAANHAGLKIGHIGHLTQVPKYEAEAAAAFAPDY